MGEHSIYLDSIPEGADEIEDVLGDGEIAIVAVEIERRGVSLQEFEFGNRKMDRDGRRCEDRVECDQDGEFRRMSDLAGGGERIWRRPVSHRLRFPRAARRGRSLSGGAKSSR